MCVAFRQRPFLRGRNHQEILKEGAVYSMRPDSITAGALTKALRSKGLTSIQDVLYSKKWTLGPDPRLPEKLRAAGLKGARLQGLEINRELYLDRQRNWQSKGSWRGESAHMVSMTQRCRQWYHQLGWEALTFEVAGCVARGRKTPKRQWRSQSATR